MGRRPTAETAFIPSQVDHAHWSFAYEYVIAARGAIFL